LARCHARLAKAATEAASPDASAAKTAAADPAAAGGIDLGAGAIGSESYERNDGSGNEK
jgi:hypothetical protein